MKRCGVSHEGELALDALRLEFEHLAIGVGLRALEREPAPPGPQLAAARDLGFVGAAMP